MDFVIAANSYTRICTHDADIVIDPKSADFGYIPDAVIYTSPEAVTPSSLNSLMTFDTMPVYSSFITKKMLSLNYLKYHNSGYDDLSDKSIIEEIISCRQKTKNTLRKNGVLKAEFAFFSTCDMPGSSALSITLKDYKILYLNHVPDTDYTLPAHNILIINSIGVQSPLLPKGQKISVQVQNMYQLYNVLDYFHKHNIKAGVDDTLSAPACEYLKLDCTVFTKSVRPLSSYKKTPNIIITEESERYPEHKCILADVFSPKASLDALYRLGQKSDAKRKIVISQSTNSPHKRGDMTFIKTGILEL